MITTLVHLGSIPSPSNSVIHLGPLPLHLYGLILAIAVLVAARISENRWVNRGHEAKDFADLVLWIIIGGVVGARAYHVASDYQLFTGHWFDAFKIWQGGLSIWGAVIGGAVVVVLLARKRKLDLGDLVDSIAPGLVLAQAIGRWGNWANQELFGKPSNLPWAVEIDSAHRPAQYANTATFHPTFLYESLWCLGVFVALLVIELRFRLMKGQVLALYLILYTAGRFVFENMRTDKAHVIGPLRLNAWVSLVVCIGGILWFLWLRGHGTPAVPHVDRLPASVDQLPES